MGKLDGQFWKPQPGDGVNSPKTSKKKWKKGKKKRKPRTEEKRMKADLSRFWSIISLKSQNSLEILKNYAEKKYKIKGDLVYLRKAFNESKKKNKKIREKAKKTCLGCGSVSECLHHIIQLQHGGNNVPENIAPVCNSCHGVIHPWLDGAQFRRMEEAAIKSHWESI